MNRERIILGAIITVEALGEEPNRRNVQAMTKLTCGKALQTADVLRVLAKYKAAHSVPLAVQGSTDAVPKIVLETADSVPPEVQASTLSRAGAHDAGAGGEELLKDSSPRPESKETITPPPPSQPELDRPALFAVPDQPTAKTKTTRVPMATRFAGTTVEHFGPLAALVRDLLGVEANLGGRTGALGAKTLDALLQRLAFWRETNGAEAFAHGLHVGISSGKGVAYGGGAMRRYDPERDAGRFASRAADEPEDDDMPTLSDLVDSGEVEAWTISPEELAKRPAGLVAMLAAQG